MVVKSGEGRKSKTELGSQSDGDGEWRRLRGYVQNTRGTMRAENNVDLVR